MKVGKAKYGGKKTSFKIQNGDNVYRILPPLGKLADAGKWYEYYRVEWGYKNSAGQNKPFQDVRKVNFKTKMVEVESAAHLRREALKERKDEIVAAFKAGNATKDQVEDAVALVKRYNLDAKYYLNAVNLEGKIGLLKLNSSLMKALRSTIETQQKKGVDPLAVENGLYLNFHRSNETGKLQDWVFSVTPYQQNVKATVNGQETIVQQAVTHTMDEAFISRLSSEAFELADMYPVLTAEQVEELVKAGDNHGALVDELLGGKQEAESTPSVDNTVAETAVEQRSEAVAETPVTSVTETSAPVQQASASVETTTVAASEVNTASNTTPSAPSGGQMSDEDFLASIGAN